ncbi:MAG: hypothetical protein KDI36_15700 [Pseudomonadales bacterium]|nr:hypothetical protein [Pseudomonadales bacterium]
MRQCTTMGADVAESVVQQFDANQCGKVVDGSRWPGELYFAANANEAYRRMKNRISELAGR